MGAPPPSAPSASLSRCCPPWTCSSAACPSRAREPLATPSILPPSPPAAATRAPTPSNQKLTRFSGSGCSCFIFGKLPFPSGGGEMLIKNNKKIILWKVINPKRSYFLCVCERERSKDSLLAKHECESWDGLLEDMLLLD